MTEEPQATAAQISSSDLAHTNTLLAMDRTLLAWVRTSLSLNAFGFTLARFIHDLEVHGTLHEVNGQYPKDLGITLMVLGIGGLICGSFDYWRSLQRIRKSMQHAPWSSSLFLAMILATICIMLMSNMLTNLDAK